MKAQRVLSEEERARFLEEFSAGNHVTRYRTPHRDYVLCQLMLDTGLWVGEVVALRWRHVDLDEQRLAVANDAGFLDRILPLRSKVVEYLQGWRERDNPKGDPDRHVFTTRDGSPVDRRAVYEMVRRRADKAGIEGKISPTVLRDTFAAELLRCAGDIHHVQRILGHERVESTRRRYRWLLEKLPNVAV